MKDRFIRPAFLDKFLKGFPESSIKKFEDCGHFPQEENLHEVKAAIQAFLGK